MQCSVMRFDKYEGLGNDFIVVEQDSPQMPKPLVRRLCDRHFGVGGDGVLIVSPTELAAARMTVLNADGSQPEMCGNGLRCVALHIATRRVSGSPGVMGGDGAAEFRPEATHPAGTAGSARFEVQTDAGIRRCDVALGAVRGEAQVTLELGRGAALGGHQHEGNGQSFRFERVTIGNPHAILFDSKLTPTEIDSLAPAISAAIPGGVNVEFVEQRSPLDLHVVVWERGVGRTLACGTGAGAVAVAAARAGRIPYDTPVQVHLPGGPLTISVAAESLQVTMTGPARHVFSGRLDPSRFC